MNTLTYLAALAAAFPAACHSQIIYERDVQAIHTVINSDVWDDENGHWVSLYEDHRGSALTLAGGDYAYDLEADGVSVHGSLSTAYTSGSITTAFSHSIQTLPRTGLGSAGIGVTFSVGLDTSYTAVGQIAQSSPQFGGRLAYLVEVQPSGLDGPDVFRIDFEDDGVTAPFSFSGTLYAGKKYRLQFVGGGDADLETRGTLAFRIGTVPEPENIVLATGLGLLAFAFGYGRLGRAAIVELPSEGTNHQNDDGAAQNQS